MLKLAILVCGLLLLSGPCTAKKRKLARLFSAIVGADYEKDSPPSSVSGTPTTVKIGYYINSLTVDTENRELSMNANIQQTWYDERLKFPSDEEREVASYGNNQSKTIWTPDTFIRNGIGKKRINEDNVLVRIYPDGRVWLAEKVMLKVSCGMRLHKFPFDTQECPILTESFRHKMDSVILKFLDDREPVSFGEKEIDGFDMKGIALKDCSKNYSTGAYPCLMVNINLKRVTGAYFRHTFVPSIIILIFIYLSTWMGNHVLLPRTLVLISGTILLGVNMVTSSLLLDHPKVSYLTAGDLWYPICVILLMIAILEFALVARLTNRADGAPETSDSKFVTCGNCCDWLFRIIFLVLIIVFVALYFIFYQYI